MSAAGAAFLIDDPSQVSAVRRAAQRLAEQVGFTDTRAGTAALVVTELATNLAKHARGGQILLRGVDDPGFIEIVALDRGPGIPDIALSQRDGYSTAGTRGEGLGAVSRQADDLQIYSAPSGTAMLARVSREPSPTPARQPRLEIGAVRVNAPGEQVCGDEWSAHLRDERLVVMLADGLGHGLAAHDAARAACTTFERVHERTPAEIVEEVHIALKGTRGAAVTVLAADLERGIARSCGLGNIAGTILLPGGDRRHSLVSLSGTAGHVMPRVQEFQYSFPAGSALVMHSDGMSSQWQLDPYPGLRTKHPTLIAGVLFRDFGRQRDDTTVVVVKDRARVIS
jgi:anti-sigma regulatory factor (Ser/Thr protein kinase)